MTRVMRMLACGAAVLLFAEACGGMRGGPRPPPMGAGAMPGSMRPISEQEQNLNLMLSYDANNDGALSREELEEAQKRLFATSDVDRDGRLDTGEMQAENDRRFRASGTGASPLIDWNRNAQIEFDEFATTARSLFAQLDRDENGQLGQDELRVPRAGRGPAMPPEGPGGRGRGPAPFAEPAFPGLIK